MESNSSITKIWSFLLISSVNQDNGSRFVYGRNENIRWWTSKKNPITMTQAATSSLMKVFPKKKGKKKAVVRVRNKQSLSLESVESNRTNESTGTSITKCFTRKSEIP